MSEKVAKHKYIKSPEKLAELFEEYREWVKENPFTKTDWVGGIALEVKRPYLRPLSFLGFESWLYDNKIICSLSSYEHNENAAYAQYLPIIARIKSIIEANQFDGAVAGVYNPNIIARKLGLSEKVSAEHTGKDGGPIKTDANFNVPIEKLAAIEEILRGGE